MLKRLILISCAIFISTYSFSQEKKRVRIIPFPNLGYAPETRWYTGGVVLFNIRFYDDTITRVSNVKPEVNFTQNRQRIFGLNYNIYFRNNRFALLGENSYSKFPENYWGVGNNTPEENVLRYEANRLEVDNHLFYQLRRYLYTGIRYRLQKITDLEIIEPVHDDSYSNPELIPGTSYGAGPVVQFDSRNSILNPKKGGLAYFSALIFDKNTGSDFSFVRYDLDLRKYVGIRKSTLAFQLRSTINTGSPPFRMMALLGSDSHMRGYYQGRYRDQHYVAMQGEYRFPVWRAWGAAIFVGTGQVSGKMDFSPDDFMPAFGAGIRIRVDKENDVNLRFDYAIGKRSEGFYVVFGEAF